MNNSNKTINNNNTINSKGKRSYSSIALRNQNIVSNLNNISTEELYLYNLIIKLNLPGSNLKNAQYEMERL